MTRQRQAAYAAAALVSGLLLRIAFVHWFAHVEGDSLVYGDLAANMLRHHAFALSEGARWRETLIRLPGYPSLLAACFATFGIGNWTAVLALQVLFDLAACLLLAAMARRLAGPPAGLATLWLAALCPFTANYTAAPLTETPTILLTTLAFYALLRWLAAGAEDRTRWLACIAFALITCLSLRPDRALLAVAIVPAVLAVSWKRHTAFARRVGPAATLCAVLLLLPLGWGVRNGRVFHVVQPLAPRSATDPGESVPTGFNRWYRTWGVELQSTFDVYWTYDGSPLNLADLPPRAIDDASQRSQTAAAYARYNSNPVATPPVDAAFDRLARQRERARPLRTFVAMPVARLADMWLRPRTEMLPLPLDWWHLRTHRLGDAIALAFGVLNLALLYLALRGLWQWRRRGWSGCRPLGYAMILFVGLRCMLLLTMDNSEPRYTLDCFPVVLLLAGMALGHLFRARLPSSRTEPVPQGLARD